MGMHKRRGSHQCQFTTVACATAMTIESIQTVGAGIKLRSRETWTHSRKLIERAEYLQLAKGP
jgi:hypothetical protein